MRNNSLSIHMAIVVVLAASSLSAEVLYHVTDLGTIGGRWSTAYSINNAGQIVGEGEPDPNLYPPSHKWHAVLFDPTGDGDNIDLIPRDYSEGTAYSINAPGQIAGLVGEPWDDARAMLFDPTGDGNNIDLGTPDEWTTYALSINDAGQIVGWSSFFDSSPPFNSLRYATLFDSTGDGNNVDLGTLGGKSSNAYSINNREQIVGWATIASGSERATLFDPTGEGNNINLGTLPAGGESQASSINDLGQIAGQADDSSGRQRAALFDPNGSGNNIDLGTIAGGGDSWANSINNAGQIVGGAVDGAGNWCAALFDPTGNAANANLNDVIAAVPAWHLQEALCINDSGWIVGLGRNSDNVRRAFLLTPVSPYDATLTLNVEPSDVGIDSTVPAPGEHKYLIGRAVDLAAQLFMACPAVYHFDHWEGDVIDPNLSLTTVIMDEDKVVTAVFVARERVCGDECHPILQGDLNGDCYINFTDFVLYSNMWLSCTHPDCD